MQTPGLSGEEDLLQQGAAGPGSQVIVDIKRWDQGTNENRAWTPDGAVRVAVAESGPQSAAPVSIPSMFRCVDMCVDMHIDMCVDM